MHTVTNQVGEKLTVLDGAPSREEILRRSASASAGRYGNTSRPCFPTRVRCSITTTVPSISIGWPKPTIAHQCRPSSGAKRP
jgi:hypothetical protein